MNKKSMMRKRFGCVISVVVGILTWAMSSTSLGAEDSKSVNQLGMKIREKARLQKLEEDANAKNAVTTKKLQRNRLQEVLLNYQENGGKCLFLCEDELFSTRWSLSYQSSEPFAWVHGASAEFIGYKKGYGDLPEDPRSFEHFLDFSEKSQTVAQGETVVFLNKNNCFLAVKILAINSGRNESRPFMLLQCRVYGGDATYTGGLVVRADGRKSIDDDFRPSEKPPADIYADARAECEALAKLIKKKEAEVLKLRKENPACLLGELTRSIINLDKKYLTTEQKRYYFNQVTFVRPHFYCTSCKIEHDNKCNTSAKQSWNRWRDHYDKISDTAVYNEKIDALMSDIESLQKQLAEAKKEKDEAYAAQQKDAPRRKRRAR